MGLTPTSPFLQALRGRITLEDVPFSDRGSRLLVFRSGMRLFIHLAERWVKWEHELGDYRHRALILNELAYIDEKGTALDFEPTAFPHALGFQTRRGDFWLAFANEETIYLKLPEGRSGITFCVRGTNGRTNRRGGEFNRCRHARGASAQVARRIECRTRAPIAIDR